MGRRRPRARPPACAPHPHARRQSLHPGRTQDRQDPPYHQAHHERRSVPEGPPLPPAPGDGEYGIPLPAGRPHLRHRDRNHHQPLQPTQPLLQPAQRARQAAPDPLHDLRHTCATLLLSKDVNPKIVSEMLGHSSISVTLDIYSHLLPDMQEKAAKALEEALR